MSRKVKYLAGDKYPGEYQSGGDNYEFKISLCKIESYDITSRFHCDFIPPGASASPGDESIALTSAFNLANENNTDANNSYNPVFENTISYTALEIQTENVTTAATELPNSILSTKQWTLIFYMNGGPSGSLNMDAGIQKDIEELKVVGSDSNINILGLADYQYNGDSEAFYITETGGKQNIPLTSIDSSWGNELNMGEPSILAKWGRYCVEYYPASNYAVILDDHGDGIIGCCCDDRSKSGVLDELMDRLTPPEIASALSRINQQIGSKKIGLVGFDACYMSLVELAYEIKDCADVMVASEMMGWYWAGLLKEGTWDFSTSLGNLANNPAMSPVELGKEFVNSYINNCKAHDTSATLSVTLLGSGISLLNDKLNALTQAIFNRWSITLKNQLTNAMTAAQYYKEGDPHTNLDLRDFAYYVWYYVSDNTIKTYANDLYNCLAEGAGVIAKNGRHKGNSTWDSPDSNRPVDKACGLAVNIYTPENLNRDAAWYYKKCRITYQRNIQNCTYLDKVLSTYYGLAIWPMGDDFSINTLLSDWTIRRDNKNNTIYHTMAQFNVAPYSIRMERQASGSGLLSMQHYFNCQGKIVVQVKMRIEYIGTTYDYLIVKGPAGEYCVHTAFLSNMSFAYYDGSKWHSVLSFSLNKWYQITLNINPVTYKFDIYTDGILRKSQAPFRESASYLNAVYFQAGWGGSEVTRLNLDDVYVKPGGTLFIDQFVNNPFRGTWTTITSGGKAIHCLSDGNGTPPCAILDKYVTSGVVAMYKSFTYQTSHVYMEAFMKVNATSSRYAYFIGRTGSYNSVYFIMAAGQFMWFDGAWKGTGVYYNANVWYEISLDISISTRTYDIYINNTLVVKGASWYNQGQGYYIDTVYYQSQSSSQPQALDTWVDDVLLLV